MESTEASSKGYGSGTSEREVYVCRKAELTDFEWFVRTSMKL
jgi:hypothetical protein